MKRHPALHPLSRDHHNVLVHARRLRGLDARVDAETARRRFRAYFDAVLAPHFDEEEQVLLPRIADAGLRQRLIAEHADLRRRAAALPAGQTELGEALRLHVRFEEDVLFPALEAQAEADRVDWPDVTAAADAFRRERRPAGVDGGAEACFL
jgi:hypothetical protein